ncbi:NAD(P)-binding domain-containing protein [Nocardiopsis sp. CNT-189]|uniref:NADPH-dependent F420 reductase n=1 Tax=Nocardiopsis oceanisediminis TaxID=2816862 RepID=UPI003B338935
MRIGVLGTGAMAEALGAGWVRAGHEVAVGGRSAEKARALAGRLGGGASAAPPERAAAGRDAVLLAVAWDGAADMLAAAGAAGGALAGVPLIDPSNPVPHGGGVLRIADGSAAERIAALAPGAHVVKAFHLFPAAHWAGPGPASGTVAMCGDDAGALETAGRLVRDLGAAPAVLGPLGRARQLEEAAGFCIGLAFAGFDPSSALPGAHRAA